MNVILVLDVGSSSVRCSAYQIVENENDGTTSVEALDGCYAQLKIRSVQPNSGKIILNGVKEDTGESYNLLDEIDGCIHKTLASLREHDFSSFQIVGLGFSTLVMNLIGVDKNGNVIGEEATISYACNLPEVAQKCRNLKRFVVVGILLFRMLIYTSHYSLHTHTLDSELGEERLEELYQKTGAPLHSAYALPQLCALYSNPDSTKDICQWQTLASLCLSRWLGVPSVPISFSEASWTGLFNFRSCQWEQDALDFLPSKCRDALPSLEDYCDFKAKIPEYLDSGKKNPYLEQWPELNESCRLFLGLGDGACANIGSKCSTPNRIAVTVGTSAAARVCLPLPISRADEPNDNGNNFKVPRGLFCYRIDKSHVLVGGALTDGGSVIEWACSLMNLKTDDAFQDCMNEVKELINEEKDCPSLTLVPFLGGERSTGYRDGASGCIMGLTRETTPARFMKACLESVMLRIKAILELVNKAIDERTDENNDNPCIVVSGNAMEANEAWRQMLADASGMEVQFDADITEGTSRGVARMVAIVLDSQCRANEEPSDSLMAEENISSPTVSSPRQEAVGYWGAATEAQDAFIDAVSPLW